MERSVALLASIGRVACVAVSDRSVHRHLPNPGYGGPGWLRLVATPRGAGRLASATLLAVGVAFVSAQTVAAAAPVSLACGAAVTTSVTLAQDIVDCPGSALIVAADGVTIDLNGHLLRGRLHQVCFGGDEPFCEDQTPLAPAIDGSGGFDGIIVRNGRTEHFQGSVLFSGVNRFQVTDVRNVGDLVGPPPVADIRVEDSRDGLVSHVNEAAASASERNTFRDVPGGLSLRNGSNHNILELTAIVSIGFHAVSVSDSSANIIRRNTFDGAEVLSLDQGAVGNIIEHNVFTGGSQFTYSIALLGASGNVIRRNRFLHPLSPGEAGAVGLCFGASQNVIENNEMRDLGVGVNLGFADCPDSSPPLMDNAVRGNRITDMVGSLVAAEDSGDGVTVGSLATGTLVENNVLLRNSNNGITVLNPSTRLASNIAMANHNLGIFAPFGAVDLGGNRAAANGNPAQCIGVRC